MRCIIHCTQVTHCSPNTACPPFYQDGIRLKTRTPQFAPPFQTPSLTPIFSINYDH